MVVARDCHFPQLMMMTAALFSPSWHLRSSLQVAGGAMAVVIAVAGAGAGALLSIYRWEPVLGLALCPQHVDPPGSDEFPSTKMIDLSSQSLLEMLL